MSTTPQAEKPARTWTAEELLKLPTAEQDAILEAAAEQAEEEYRTNPELTSFDAFGEKDLYGDSSSSEPG